MARRKRRVRRQVTCLCSRYPFPHRLGGGRCRGCEWCESYFETDARMCSECNCNVDGHCEVAVGQERLAYCEGAADNLHAASTDRHPREHGWQVRGQDYWPETSVPLVECPF